MKEAQGFVNERWNYLGIIAVCQESGPVEWPGGQMQDNRKNSMEGCYVTD